LNTHLAELTRIPFGPSSRAIHLVNISIADFAKQ